MTRFGYQDKHYGATSGSNNLCGIQEEYKSLGLGELVINVVNDTIDDADEILSTKLSSPIDFPTLVRLDSLYMIPLLETAIPLDTPLCLQLAKRPSAYRLIHSNSNWTTAIALTKGMIGTFVLYLPYLYHSVGILYGTFFLLFFAILSTWGMLLISECSDLTACQHYGDIGEIALKSFLGRAFVDLSIFLSQLGYCISYYTYISSNVLSFPIISSNLTYFLGARCNNEFAMILLLVLLFIPLSWVRRLSHLSRTLVCANIFILSGVFVTYGYSVYNIVQTGPKSVELFDSTSLSLYISTTVIAFEGAGLILPIKHSMARVQDFPAVLTKVMTILSLLFVSFSLVVCLAYGSHTARFATLNLPDNCIGVFVRLSYSAAIVLTFPLQLYPAVHILERAVFPSSKTQKSRCTTAMKNVCRSLVVAGTAGVSYVVSAGGFDNFMGLIGSLCVVPLSLVYPPLFHILLCNGRKDRNTYCVVAEWSLLCLGVFMMIFCTFEAIVLWH